MRNNRNVQKKILKAIFAKKITGEYNNIIYETLDIYRLQNLNREKLYNMRNKLKKGLFLFCLYLWPRRVYILNAIN